MPKITVTKKGSGRWRVYVDETGDAHRVSFDGDEGEATVDAGEHVLIWFIVGGRPEADYTIAITEPARAAFEYEGSLDDGGEDSGQKDFEA